MKHTIIKFDGASRFDLFLIENPERTVTAIASGGRYYSAKISPDESLADIFGLRECVTDEGHCCLMFMNNDTMVVMQEIPNPATKDVVQSDRNGETLLNEIKTLRDELATVKDTNKHLLELLKRYEEESNSTKALLSNYRSETRETITILRERSQLLEEMITRKK